MRWLLVSVHRMVTHQMLLLLLLALHRPQTVHLRSGHMGLMLLLLLLGLLHVVRGLLLLLLVVLLLSIGRLLVHHWCVSIANVMRRCSTRLLMLRMVTRGSGRRCCCPVRRLRNCRLRLGTWIHATDM